MPFKKARPPLRVFVMRGVYSQGERISGVGSCQLTFVLLRGLSDVFALTMRLHGCVGREHLLFHPWSSLHELQREARSSTLSDRVISLTQMHATVALTGGSLAWPPGQPNQHGRVLALRQDHEHCQTPDLMQGLASNVACAEWNKCGRLVCADNLLSNSSSNIFHLSNIGVILG